MDIGDTTSATYLDTVHAFFAYCVAGRANGFAERTLDAGLASWAERHVQLPHVDMEIDRPRVRPLETLRKSYVARNCRVEQATV